MKKLLILTLVALTLASQAHASGMNRRRESPTTTKGDIIVHNGTSDARLAVGANGTVLEADSTANEGVRWISPDTAAPVDATFITQTANATLTNEQAIGALSTGYLKGATTTGIITSTATIPSTDVTNLGSMASQNSTSISISGGTITGITDLTVADGGTGTSSQTDGGVLIGKGTSAFTNTGVLAKGTVIVGDGTTDPTTLTVGANGTILSADSSTTSGLRWASISSYDAGTVVEMTDGATITPNLDLGKVFRVTLGGSRILGTPINGTHGRRYIFIISQDATGSRTLTYSPFYRFGSDVTSPTLTTTAGRQDYLGMVYQGRNNNAKVSMDVVAIAKGYAD